MSDRHDSVSSRWSQWRASTDLDEYYSRWRRLEATGQPIHGEADLIESLHPWSVLDAGCGMGRVAIELARRGIDVVGVDLDDDLLAFARRSQPALTWLHADLATMRLDRRFDVVAMPGNLVHRQYGPRPSKQCLHTSVAGRGLPRRHSRAMIGCLE